jgi:ring-1,2-phenylacetyl-CoA epoxidase subunit PaaD
MVDAASEALCRQAWEIAAAVVDPEIPVLTIADLGVLRDVAVRDGAIEVSITPTYCGCPAMHAIALDVERALDRAGIAPVRVKTVLAPAWTTDWLTAAARRKLAECGIAPPRPHAHALPRALFSADPLTCPRCGAADTECLSEFGSTACKALWRCKACREPFEHFKCH